MLRTAGWLVNDKRVERIWRQEGLKVPMKQSKRSRLLLSDGSCVRLRAERPNLVQTKLGAQLFLNKAFAVYSDFQGEFSSMSQSYGGTAGMKYYW